MIRMGLESSSTPMVINTRESGKMVRKVERASTTMLMEIVMKESGRTINATVLALST